MCRIITKYSPSIVFIFSQQFLGLASGDFQIQTLNTTFLTVDTQKNFQKIVAINVLWRFEELFLGQHREGGTLFPLRSVVSQVVGNWQALPVAERITDKAGRAWRRGRRARASPALVPKAQGRGGHGAYALSLSGERRYLTGVWWLPKTLLPPSRFFHLSSDPMGAQKMVFHGRGRSILRTMCHPLGKIFRRFSLKILSAGWRRWLRRQAPFFFLPPFAIFPFFWQVFAHSFWNALIWETTGGLSCDYFLVSCFAVVFSSSPCCLFRT